MDFSLKDVQLYPDSLKPFLNNMNVGNSSVPSGVVLSALLVILLLFFIFYCITSGVLYYHWNTYGMKRSTIFLMEIVFVFGSIFLFIGAVNMLLYI
jgi:hypothetical protein